MAQTTHFDWIFLFGILSASLAGSFHCVSMCGGLVMAATHHASGKKMGAHFSYHLFRWMGYIAVGGVAGFFGQKILSNDLSHTVNGVAAFVISASLVWTGLRLWDGKKEFSWLSKKLSHLSAQVHGKAFRLPDEIRPGAMGFLSVFLPCGWLYSFVLVAIATGSFFKGAVVLTVFWAGTLPALIGGGYGLTWLYSKLPGKPQKVIAVLFIAAGVYAMTSKMGWTRMPWMGHGHQHEQQHSTEPAAEEEDHSHCH